MRGSQVSAVVGLLFVAAACGGSSSESSATNAPATEAPAPATQPPATEPAATQPPATDPPATDPPATEPPVTEAPETTTTLAPEAIVIGEADGDGVVPVAVDGTLLDPLFNQFIDGSDPFFHVHTQQEDVFISVEMYSVFGDEWTGELGTFPTDCTTHGICVYFDPDGTGPLLGGGPAEGGQVTISQLDGEIVVTLDAAPILTDDGIVYSLNDVTLGG